MTPRVQASVLGGAFRTSGGDDVAALAHASSGQRFCTVPAPAPWCEYPAAAAGIGAITTPLSRTPHDRILRRLALHGYHVAVAALTHAAIVGSPRIGLYVGIGGLRAQWDDLIPALQQQTPDFVAGWQRGLKQLHPFWMLQHLSNNTHALLSKDLGARGEGFTFGGSNAGAQALESAIAGLASGVNDIALVLAYDSLLEPELLLHPTVAGFPSEAAAAVVLQATPPNQGRYASIEARTCADANDGAPAKTTLDRLMATMANTDATTTTTTDEIDAPRAFWPTAHYDTSAMLGDVGAAMAVTQSLLWAHRHAARVPSSAASAATLCLSVGAPGLAGVVRVSTPS